jgi:hypothetical protein
MPVDISTVEDNAQLFSVLSKLDISVPLRTEGRKTEHTETWAICRLLATLAESNFFRYPLSVKHRDRPDFFLRDGKTQIGCEVTEAVSEQYAAYSALAEREFPEVFLEPSHFRWGQEARSVEEMRTLLRQTKLTAPPWVGDRPEREWASYIGSIIDSKTEKLRKPAFGKFEENWLAVYDNLPLSHIELDKAIGFLYPKLESYWSSVPAFGSVFIEHGPVIAKLSSIETRIFILHDLW